MVQCRYGRGKRHGITGIEIFSGRCPGGEHFPGGGTIAYLAAKYGMFVLDAGVAVLSMHAPWEVTSVFDINETYKAYKIFLTIEDKLEIL